MKIKVIKTKIENNNKDIKFNDYFNHSIKIYEKQNLIVEEIDGQYLYIIIYFDYFDYKDNKIIDKIKTPTPEKLTNEAFDLYNKYFMKEVSIKYRLYEILENYEDFKIFNDYAKIKGLGNKKIKNNQQFFEELLIILNKYQQN